MGGNPLGRLALWARRRSCSGQISAAGPAIARGGARLSREARRPPRAGGSSCRRNPADPRAPDSARIAGSLHAGRLALCPGARGSETSPGGSASPLPGPSVALYGSVLLVLPASSPRDVLAALGATSGNVFPFLVWRCSYVMLAGKRGSAAASRFRDHLFYSLPVWGGTTPLGKGYGYLQQARADAPTNRRGPARRLEAHGAGLDLDRERNVLSALVGGVGSLKAAPGWRDGFGSQPWREPLPPPARTRGLLRRSGRVSGSSSSSPLWRWRYPALCDRHPPPLRLPSVSEHLQAPARQTVVDFWNRYLLLQGAAGRVLLLPHLCRRLQRPAAYRVFAPRWLPPVSETFTTISCGIARAVFHAARGGRRASPAVPFTRSCSVRQFLSMLREKEGESPRRPRTGGPRIAGCGRSPASGFSSASSTSGASRRCRRGSKSERDSPCALRALRTPVTDSDVRSARRVTASGRRVAQASFRVESSAASLQRRISSLYSPWSWGTVTVTVECLIRGARPTIDGDSSMLPKYIFPAFLIPAFGQSSCELDQG